MTTLQLQPRLQAMPPQERLALERRARLLACGGNAWHVVEFAIAVGAGIAAGSIAFLTIGSRRIEYVACTSKPNTDWMLQEARNLLMDLDDRERQVRRFEEGFGGFRGTWLIGHVSTADAEATLREEGALLRILDAAASSPGEFEELASAIEANELDKVADPLRLVATEYGIEELLHEELVPLHGLEIGVAGVTHALSSIGCLTAASCRSHTSTRSWSDCPVVFFAAPAWRFGVAG